MRFNIKEQKKLRDIVYTLFYPCICCITDVKNKGEYAFTNNSKIINSADEFNYHFKPYLTYNAISITQRRDDDTFYFISIKE